ncbi:MULTISPECIES: molecular chaperone [unclassified Serratia (in: enterobacteria)]|uniref:fimbrial biogenesis chaperone n=1 Tax=unclassified Serratia (in: enterobacteria) TaxID=2647522 RepID=UPI0004692FCD|nr:MULTISPECIES: molecular chaperone [unclassified Serratia (in: enterobacteria)]
MTLLYRLFCPLRTCIRGAVLLSAIFLLAGAQAAPEAAAKATMTDNVEPKGISFYVLRVIYPESERKGVTLTAYNKTDRPYLMQSRIRPVDPATGNVDMSEKGATATAMPFIVTPPLARLEANGELTLRIRRNDEVLPSDRESVFFISMKAIPSQTAPEARSQDAQQMVLTVVSNIKVFYRPEGLNKRALVDTDVASKLRFRRDGNRLIADNPTPYWLTFSRLKVGTAALDKAQLRLMVPPFGKQVYSFPAVTAGSVTWQLIDEDGWDTPIQQRPL